MPTDLHFICKHGLNHHRIEGNLYESGEWAKVSDQTANEAIGSRIYLHETQDGLAWHGGTITQWGVGDDHDRKVFRYIVDGPFRIRCPFGWGREKAIVRR